MKQYICAILLIFWLLPLSALANSINAGFVEGLWYSNSSVLSGTPVRIYAAIRNNTGSDLSGTVEFFVNDKKIGSSEVQALSGRVIETWADWTPSFGTSTVKAALTRTRINPIGEHSESIVVSAAESIDYVYADIDTDGDGIGNNTDTDDDGDGVSDSEEFENGTDPLTYDEPVETENSSASEDGASEDNTKAQSSDSSSAGLEQYLTDSRARSALSEITNVINTSKEKIDTYRAERNQSLERAQADTATSSDIGGGDGEYTENGFGTVTRSTGSNDSGFFSGLVLGVGSLWTALVTFFLFVFSQVLAHPALVQVALLLLILFGVYKLAQKYGGRQP